ncbi:GntR family transcriptional regulator [Mesorhizobium sp. M1C.F.Ca.ET.193.01.1.1]|nr:MAG: GntR family transcriptional regulator [Mesorhizobium sp.]TGQ50679.1 GntR family transcriptional regulator [Mesorhizobium sp. M1C.F.Ca.ET.210.01.1.1]TGQ65845.1 GntR family transcriptional regulator [Mesorhizobium sp. M1C.F.Ca.ET.212.01.1.1]TGQ99850.1 GntR family transcriptional regulator [Mesorhizobium sp. M1C.F.Ca.ET.204.01.1.1]TGR20383.1 GntR family transcriptional regulator [Mesorhizobium sp. M1C.F.Ca.ET.196.01.1.1]TGR43058.1 GntR family transcriptional regulator [Mesorhizobium sp. M
MRKKVCLRLPKWLYDGYFEPGDRLPRERDLMVELGLLRKLPAAHAGPDGASARLLRHVEEWHFRRRVRATADAPYLKGISMPLRTSILG